MSKKLFNLFHKLYGWELTWFLGMLLAMRSANIRLLRGVLNFYTGLFASLFVVFLAFLILQLSFRFFKKHHKLLENISTSVVTVFFLLFLLELLLRGIGLNASYGEQNGNSQYFSEAAFENRNSWYFTQTPNQEIRYDKAEFVFERTTNSLGLCEKEIPFEKDSTEFRILALGDSFTEGDGVSADSTWLKTVERNLQERYPTLKVTTINAGYGGSDVVYESVLLRDKLLPYQPDLVILSTNFSDQEDISVRGGFERFQADGTIKVVERPSWEWIYGSSYTFRFIIRAAGSPNRLSLKNVESINESPVIAMEAVRKVEDICKRESLKLLIVTHPLDSDLLQNEYDSQAMNVMVDSLRKSGIQYIDLREKYWDQGFNGSEKLDSIFWPINRHFNFKGYELYGKYVSEEIAKLGWLEN